MTEKKHPEYIEIRFKGEGVRPEAVRASEIAELIIAVGAMIEAQVYKQNPLISKDQLVLSFTNIKSQSIGLEYRSPLPDIANSAFQDVGRAIKTKNFTEMPSNSYKSFNTLVNFTKKWNCSAELSLNNGVKNVIAEITPDMKIGRPPALKAETIIYAKVVRVGGKEPKVEIETVDGNTLYCVANREIVTKLGTKLYQIVGLQGVAEWDNDLDNIEQFAINEITDYEKVSLKGALDELAKTTSGFYTDITDVTEYVSKLRGSSNT